MQAANQQKGMLDRELFVCMTIFRVFTVAKRQVLPSVQNVAWLHIAAKNVNSSIGHNISLHAIT